MHGYGAADPCTPWAAFMISVPLLRDFYLIRKFSRDLELPIPIWRRYECFGGV